jgi:putative ABC transport system permease protein
VAAVALLGGWTLERDRFRLPGRALSGFTTAFVSVRFGILHLLASILTMIALFSINLRIMGRRTWRC